MARYLDSVVLTVPSGNLDKSANDTFTMTMHWTEAGSGTPAHADLYWQWDQGTSTWEDIPTTGTTGLVASAGYEADAAEATDFSRTITCKSAGTYVIRARAWDANNSIEKLSTNTPTITIAQNNFTYTGSGQFIFSGSATNKLGFSYAGSGQFIFSGSATNKLGFSYAGSGSFIFSGNASYSVPLKLNIFHGLSFFGNNF